jgi:hypothetical protein
MKFEGRELQFKDTGKEVLMVGGWVYRIINGRLPLSTSEHR